MLMQIFPPIEPGGNTDEPLPHLQHPIQPLLCTRTLCYALELEPLILLLCTLFPHPCPGLAYLMLVIVHVQILPSGQALQ